MENAIDIANKGCKLNDPNACSFEGQLHYQRGPEFSAKAIVAFEQSCVLGKIESCVNVGNLHYAAGRKSEGVNHLTSICDKSPPTGCDELAAIYETGYEKVPADRLKAINLRRSACDKGDTNACSNLGWMLQTGSLPTKADLKEALSLYQKACDGGNGFGCGNLGMMLADGNGLEKDDKRALGLLHTGCEGGAGDACRYLSEFHLKGRAGLNVNPVAASLLLKRGCEFGDKQSCEN